MKKLSKEDKERNIRIANVRLSSRIKRRQAPSNDPEISIKPYRTRVVAPTSFDLIKDMDGEVVEFIEKISTYVLTKKRPVALDFRKTTIFYAPATVYLFASLDRVISLSELNKPVTIISPQQTRPREVLKQIGLYALTGDTCDIVPKRKDVVCWHATKGNTQSGDILGPVLEATIAKANEQSRNFEIKEVWRGVSEAMANSVEHAYKKPRDDGFIGLEGTKWWMFTQLKDNFLCVALCDLGCGYRNTITESIPETIIAETVKALQGYNRDAVAIEAAMAYGRSGTKLNHRGKGSRDALTLLSTHGNGELVLISNEGWLKFSCKNGTIGKSKKGGLMSSIGGTIVWWKLALSEIEND